MCKYAWIALRISNSTLKQTCLQWSKMGTKFNIFFDVNSFFFITTNYHSAKSATAGICPHNNWKGKSKRFPRVWR